MVWQKHFFSAKSCARVSRLFVHPVKGCAPVEVNEIWLDKLGVANDRRWAVLDMAKEPDARILTSRLHPRLALIVPSVEPGKNNASLELSAPGMPPLHVPQPGAAAEQLDVSLWTVSGLALDCGDEAALWLVKFFGQQSLRLAFIPVGEEGGDSARPRAMCTQVQWNDGDEARSVYLAGTEVAFADSTHLTLLSEASLVDLNRRVPRRTTSSFTPERFRMNILLSHTRAYEEETWKSFDICANSFEVARLCNRCTVVAVDPATGETKNLPLQLLRGYRSKEHLWRVDPRHGTKPIFGIKACARRHEGPIRVGDTISGIVLRGIEDRMY